MSADDRLPSASPDAAETYLRRFCETVLDLLREGSAKDSVLPRILPGLARALGEGSRGMVAQLRSELQSWREAADPLKKLSQSSFIQFGDEAAALLTKLERAQDRVADVVAALEGLQITAPRPGDAETPAEKAEQEGEDEDEEDEDETLPLSFRHEEELPPDPCPLAGTDVNADANVPPLDEPSDKERAGILYREAEGHWHKRQLDAAAELYTQALHLDPLLRPAYLRRARIWILQGHTDPAIEDLTVALEMNDSDPLANWWRGDAHALAGQHDTAIADYTRALTLAPTLFLARYNRAVSLRLGGDPRRALEEFNHLLQVKPGHAPLYLNRGLVHLAHEDGALAADDFRAALRYQPGSREASQRLQEAEELVRQQEEPLATASDEAEESTDENPDEDGVATPSISEKALVSTTAGPTKTRKAFRASATTGWTRTLERSKVNSLAFQCPGCRKPSAVRWDKLSLGKVLGCPHCMERFTAKLDGRLVKVLRDRQGRWVDTEWAESRSRQVRQRRLKAAAAALIVFLTIYTLTWTPRLVESLKPAPAVGLPTDLVSRAEFFARAWLKGDMLAMRQMTDPAQDRQLFRWYRSNLPPAEAKSPADGGGVQVDVEIAPDNPSAASLRVRFESLQPNAPNRPVELQLSWLERGGTWVFRPAPNLKLQAGM